MSAKTFATHAADLEACLPPPSSAARATPGGIIAAIIALVDALKAGDVGAIASAFLALIQMLVGNPAQNATAAANLGINWKNLLDILAKLLPLILGG